MLYHHCRSLDSIVFGDVKADSTHQDPDSKDAYSWLEKQIGFKPLFLSVGENEDDLRMTGYPDNWRRVIKTKIVRRRKDGIYIHKNILRKKGEFPNEVLFSFEDIGGVFMDYDYWPIVLNSEYKNYELTDYETRLIFKPSYKKSDWLRKAGREAASVQIVTKSLHLPDAARIWVRNKKTKKLLDDKGFNNVEVRRLIIEGW